MPPKSKKSVTTSTAARAPITATRASPRKVQQKSKAKRPPAKSPAQARASLPEPATPSTSKGTPKRPAGRPKAPASAKKARASYQRPTASSKAKSAKPATRGSGAKVPQWTKKLNGKNPLGNVQDSDTDSDSDSQDESSSAIDSDSSISSGSSSNSAQARAPVRIKNPKDSSKWLFRVNKKGQFVAVDPHNMKDKHGAHKSRRASPGKAKKARKDRKTSKKKSGKFNPNHSDSDQSPSPVSSESEYDSDSSISSEDSVIYIQPSKSKNRSSKHKLKTNMTPKKAPTPSPQNSIGHPLSLTVARSVKKKIWKGQFVEFSEILKKKDKNLQKTVTMEMDEEGGVFLQGKQSKMYVDWDSWLEAFLLFSDIILTKDPFQCRGLMYYLDRIRMAKKDYPGQTWATYDRFFRIKKASMPHMSWDEFDQDLWVTHVLKSLRDLEKPNTKNTTSNTKSQSQNPPQSSAPAPSAPKKKVRRGGQTKKTPYPKDICMWFNKGTCNRNPCSYSHKCETCKQWGHPKLSCPQGTQGQGGQGAPKA